MDKFINLYMPIIIAVVVLGSVVLIAVENFDFGSDDDEGSGPGSGVNVPEDYHAEIDGWAIGTQLSTFQEFPVEEGAISGMVSLDGDEGFHGMNDLDMTVTGANGKVVGSSAGGGPDEEVTLGEFEFYRGGTGTYQVEIQNFVGDPAISYHLTIDVYYTEQEEESEA